MLEDACKTRFARDGVTCSAGGPFAVRLGLVEQLLQIRRILLRIGSACLFEGAIS
jgi:hypothetical protein